MKALRLAAITLVVLGSGADTSQGCGPIRQAPPSTPPSGHDYGSLGGRCVIYLNDELILSDACWANVQESRVDIYSIGTTSDFVCDPFRTPTNCAITWNDATFSGQSHEANADVQASGSKSGTLSDENLNVIGAMAIAFTADDVFCSRTVSSGEHARIDFSLAWSP